MSEHGGKHPAGATAAWNSDYRIAHLQDRLAVGDLAELGVRIEARGGAVMLTGTVPSAQCREEVLRVVHEELTGLAVHSDLVVAETSSPDHAEEVT